MDTVTSDTRTVPVNAGNWQSEIFASNQPVLVDFWAEWCAPCRALSPVLEAVAATLPWLKVVTVDVGAYPAIPAEMSVQSLPTLLLVKDGVVRGQVRAGTLRQVLQGVNECMEL